MKRCQSSDARLDYGFDWTHVLARKWQRDRPFDTGVVIRPAGEPTGWEYISSGGQSGAEEPIFPKILGATIKDGSIIWTTQGFTGDSLQDQILSDTWTTSDPTGLTVEAQSPINSAGLQQTSVILSEGVAGVTYIVENEVVTDLGYEYMARIILTIE